MKTSIPDWFRSTAIGEKLEREELREVAKNRKATGAELADLRKRLAEGVGPLRLEVERATERITTAQKRLEVELSKGREAQLQLRRFTINLEHRIHLLEVQLRESADPALDRFAEEIAREIEATCKLGPTVEHSLERDAHTFRPSHVSTNRPSILARLERLREIRDHAIPDLRLQVGIDLEQEFERLRASVPAIDAPAKPELVAVGA